VPVADLPVLARRWYVVLAGVLAVLALCWGAAVLVPAKYEVTSTVLILPPPTIVGGKPANPYTNLGGMDGITDVLSAASEDPSVEEAIQEAGFEAEYTVERDPTRSSPVLLLNVLGMSEKDALRAQTFLLDLLPFKLDELQGAVGVPIEDRIISTVVTQDETPESDRKSQIRIVLVVAVVGLGGTYLAASVIDGVLMGRSRFLGSRTSPGVPLPGGQSQIPTVAPAFDHGASVHDPEPTA
jgi:hypothetical protein